MTVTSRHSGGSLRLAWLLLQLLHVVLGMRGCRQSMLLPPLLVLSSMLHLLLVMLMLLLKVLQHALLLVLLPVLEVFWRDVDDRGAVALHGLVALPAGGRLEGGALLTGLGHGSLGIPCVLEELVNGCDSILFVLFQAKGKFNAGSIHRPNLPNKQAAYTTKREVCHCC